MTFPAFFIMFHVTFLSNAVLNLLLAGVFFHLWTAMVEDVDFRLELSYRPQRDLSSVEHIAYVASIDSPVIS
jgi:hypothetical protein